MPPFLERLLGRNLSRFVPALRRYRGRLLFVLLLQTLGTLLGLASPLLIQIGIDRVFLARDSALLWPLALTLFAASTLGLVLSSISSYWNTWITTRVLLDLRFRLFRHLQRLPIPFYVRSRVGDLQARLGGDLAEIQSFATDVPLSLAGALLTIVGVTGFLLYYSPRLFLLALLFVPPAALLLRFYRKRLEQGARRIRDENGALASQIQEGLLGIRLIRLYRLERREAGRFLGRNREIINLVLRYQVLQSLAQGLPGLLIGLGTVLTFYVGARTVLRGDLTLGALVAFGIYQVRLYGPVQSLFGLYLRLQRVRAAADRVGELLDEPVRALSPDAQSPPHHATIEFQQVTFAYRADVPVLSGLSFRVDAGERVALVGESGVGKTTVLDLLFRFYEPTGGRILVGGVPLRDLRLGRFLDEVAVVSQEAFLFHASLRENLEVGRHGASEAEVVEAARRAGVERFAAAWPNGMDTVVGERGLALSGGQRQRVSLARAILRRPRLLVLDEATSQLDLEADAALRGELLSLEPRPTLLAVTHRVDQLESFDRVLLLEEGRIAWEGSPAAWREKRSVEAGARPRR